MRDVLLAVLILTCIWTQAKASDLSMGVLLGSNHPYSDGARCDGVLRDYVEDNLGAFVRYKYLLVGRYENSYGNCDGTKYSNWLGFEAPLGQLGPVVFSVTAAIADGYPEPNFVDGYLPWGSINGKIGPFKVFYSYKVIAFGMEINL